MSNQRNSVRVDEEGWFGSRRSGWFVEVFKGEGSDESEVVVDEGVESVEERGKVSELSFS